MPRHMTKGALQEHDDLLLQLVKTLEQNNTPLRKAREAQINGMGLDGTLASLKRLRDKGLIIRQYLRDDFGKMKGVIYTVTDEGHNYTPNLEEV